MATKRFQKQQVFWWDLEKKPQVVLHEYCEDLKETRKYTWFMHTAVRIARGLMKRDINPLIEAFPFVVEEILRRFAALDDETINAIKLLARMGVGRPMDTLTAYSRPVVASKPLNLIEGEDNDEDVSGVFLNSLGSW